MTIAYPSIDQAQVLTDEQVRLLNQPLQQGVIKARTQGNTTLDYVEAHYVIRKMNTIFGFAGWNRRLTSMNMVQCEQLEVERTSKGGTYVVKQWYVGYTSTVRVEVGNIVREGTGFGQGIDKDLGRAHESAIKEAESDAMKRALITFGDQFGLALYDKKKEHVAKDDEGDTPPAKAPEPKRSPDGPTTKAAKVSASGEWLKEIGVNAEEWKPLRAALKGIDISQEEIVWEFKENVAINSETSRATLASDFIEYVKEKLLQPVKAHA